MLKYTENDFKEENKINKNSCEKNKLPTSKENTA